MKLREKLVTLIFIFVVLSMLSIMWISNQVIMKSYLALEEENAIVEAERAFNGAEFLIKRLEPLVVDWAHWDDTYDFIEAYNIEFVYSNIVPASFSETEMEYLVIQDLDGNVMLERAYNLEREYFTNLPEGLTDELANHVNQTGILWVNEKPVVVSVQEVTDSDMVLAPNGYITFGFNFDDGTLEALRDAFKSDIQITHGVEQNPDMGIQLHRTDFNTVATFQVPYLNAGKAMEVDVTIPNRVSALGRETVANLTILLGLVLFAFSLTLYYSLRRIILERLSKMESDVYQITHSEDLGRRLSIQGSDEISNLKDGINVMLEKIQEMNKKITDYATYDMMTGTLNRRAGFHALENLIKMSKMTDSPLAIGYFDVNNLKVVNDHYGHQAGDQLIKDVTDLLTASIRQSDRICRLGGDEFLLIFPRSDLNNVEQVFARIEDNIAEFNEMEERPYKVAVSKGMAIYGYDMTVDEFIEIADKRMYADKQANRKRRQE